MALRTSSSLLAACGLAAALAAPQARAWSYEEHFRITLQAFDLACQELAQQGRKVGGWCGNQHVRVCMAHLVAAAADHVGHVGRFMAQDGRTQEYLIGERLNCQNPAGWPAGPPGAAGQDTPRPEPGAKVQPLVAENMSRWLEYGRLASANFEHFQPLSRMAWAERFRKHVQGGREAGVNAMVWHMGFALHFLQDSFSAGHNGLRRAPLRQDYAQLYHDDFNAHGVLLSNAAGQEWYAYGDRHLGKVSRYVYAGPALAPGAAAEPLPVDALNKLGMQGTLTEQQWKDFRASRDRWRVLSAVPVDSAGKPQRGGMLCTLQDACEKAQVVLVNDAPPAQDTRPKHCAPGPALPGLVVVQCADTENHVTAATVRALRAFVQHLAEAPAEQVEGDFSAAEALVPVRYRSIEPGYGRSGINAEPRALRPTEPKPLDEPDALDFNDWVFALECLSGTPTGGSRCAFVSGLSSLFGKSDAQLLQDLQGGIRVGWVDSNGRWLNSFDVALLYRPPELRVLKNVVGIAPKLSMGLERIWEGRDRRGYVGMGLSFDMHFGRTKLFVDYEQLAFRRQGAFQCNPYRVSIGLKLGAISLYQPGGVTKP